VERSGLEWMYRLLRNKQSLGAATARRKASHLHIHVYDFDGFRNGS
jgi:hypothetical protein